MKSMHGSTACAITVAVALATVGCLSKQEIKTARSSVYDADFALVYSAAVEAVRNLYPTFDEDPASGVIKTAWHQVKFSDPGADDPKTTQVADRAAGAGANTPNGSSLGYNPSLARRLYFIRFNVVVAGVRPWRVRVVGTASELRPGDSLPTELRGEATPHWLGGRTDALQVDIYRRLKAYAIQQPDEAPPAAAVEEDVAITGDAPAPARTAAAAVVRALHKRDYPALRRQLADDLAWSAGAPPGADLGLAMWKADPSVLTALEAALLAGCGGDGEAVSCPAAPTPGQPRARFGLRGGVWKLIGFVEDPR
ncbi:MAG: hypothetical protein R3B06_17170 [Kofleriaceae bacterium]